MSESLSVEDSSLVPQSNLNEELIQMFAKIDDDTRFENAANREFKNAMVIYNQPGDNAKLRAMRLFSEFADNHADDFRGYLGMLESITNGFTTMIPKEEHLENHHSATLLSSIMSICHMAKSYALMRDKDARAMIEKKYDDWDSERKRHWDDVKQKIQQKANEELSRIDAIIATNNQAIREKEDQSASTQQHLDNLRPRIADLINRENYMKSQHYEAKKRSEEKKRKKAKVMNFFFRVFAVIIIALLLFLIIVAIIDSGPLSAILAGIILLLPLVGKLYKPVSFLGIPHRAVWKLIKRVDMYSILRDRNLTGYTSLANEIRGLQDDEQKASAYLNSLSFEINSLINKNTQLENEKTEINKKAKEEFVSKVDSAIERITPYLRIVDKYGMYAQLE